MRSQNMLIVQKIRLLGLCVALCFMMLAGCGDGEVRDEEPREQFPPITYEPTVEQDHVKDGVFTSEPFEIDEEE